MNTFIFFSQAKQVWKKVTKTEKWFSDDKMRCKATFFQIKNKTQNLINSYFFYLQAKPNEKVTKADRKIFTGERFNWFWLYIGKYYSPIRNFATLLEIRVYGDPHISNFPFLLFPLERMKWHLKNRTTLRIDIYHYKWWQCTWCTTPDFFISTKH